MKKLLALPLVAMLAMAFAACGSESVEEGNADDVAEAEQALPGREYETTFYNNAAHDEEIGFRFYNCYGPPTTSGQTSIYQTTVYGEVCPTITTGGGGGCCSHNGQCPAECDYCTEC
jgi:hypothetical protein